MKEPDRNRQAIAFERLIPAARGAVLSWILSEVSPEGSFQNSPFPDFEKSHISFKKKPVLKECTLNHRKAIYLSIYLFKRSIVNFTWSKIRIGMVSGFIPCDSKQGISLERLISHSNEQNQNQVKEEESLKLIKNHFICLIWMEQARKNCALFLLLIFKFLSLMPDF